MDMVIRSTGTGMLLPPWHSQSRFLPSSIASNSSARALRLRLRCVSEAAAGELTARERRRLRQHRRESHTASESESESDSDGGAVRHRASNWREQVEERLLVEAKINKKKKQLSRAQKLSINGLTQLGPQWWALRVSTIRTSEIATLLSRSLSTTFPQVQFKIYNPSVRHRRKSKDGAILIKQKPLVPGTMYLHCILDRQVHDFVKNCQGIGGFVGSQIEASHEEYFTKPRPVSADDLQAVLLREKEEQAAVDKAFKEKEEGIKKPPPSKKLNHAYLLPGVSVRVLSGPFADYTGCLKELHLKKRKATVELLLFGKESTVELDIDQIDAVTA
ncbi:Transcription termination/antitermination protein NusG [Carex littledalei]|uniref:Transcription termination/antitermination protein NusG n=1 Tax=Carex littledalei TaxID=544730 RepID=A0A833VD03_9POAL|nr:Transcription termination/antitermination protein NusG [Carex littledalei]